MKTISKVRDGKTFTVTKQLEEVVDKDILLNRKASLLSQENELKRQIKFLKEKIDNIKAENDEVDSMLKEIEQAEAEEEVVADE